MDKKPKKLRVPPGGVTLPLPPELIDFDNPSVITPKSPMEFDRDQEEYVRELRRRKGM